MEVASLLGLLFWLLNRVLSDLPCVILRREYVRNPHFSLLCRIGWPIPSVEYTRWTVTGPSSQIFP
jgi:hypothetical protein